MSASEILAMPEAFKRPAEAPRVPDLPCPKCGEPDTSMRFCNGGYSLSWGMCVGAAEQHFHRGCPRCKHRWTTHDVLAEQ